MGGRKVGIIFAVACRFCASEREAIDAGGPSGRQWPCYFAPSDTTGEKPVEEFHRTTDVIDEDRFRAAGVARETPPDPGVIETFLAEIARIRAGSGWTKAAVTVAIRAAVPELVHKELGRNLDQKM